MDERFNSELRGMGEKEDAVYRSMDEDLSSTRILKDPGVWFLLILGLAGITALFFYYPPSDLLDARAKGGGSLLLLAIIMYGYLKLRRKL